MLHDDYQHAQGDVKKELLLMAEKLDKIEKALHFAPNIPSNGDNIF